MDFDDGDDPKVRRKSLKMEMWGQRESLVISPQRAFIADGQEVWRDTCINLPPDESFSSATALEKE